MVIDYSFCLQEETLGKGQATAEELRLEKCPLQFILPKQNDPKLRLFAMGSDANNKKVIYDEGQVPRQVVHVSFSGSLVHSLAAANHHDDDDIEIGKIPDT